jgi:hypothetical protein
MIKSTKEFRTFLLKQAKKAFLKKYKRLWCTNVDGGINGVGIGGDEPSGIVVRVESSQEVFDAIPKSFMGFPVYKEIIGKKMEDKCN